MAGSWYIKGTGESTLITDSPVPLMHHDPDRSWITDPNSDHLKRTHSPVPLMYHDPDSADLGSLTSFIVLSGTFFQVSRSLWRCPPSACLAGLVMAHGCVLRIIRWFHP